MKLSFVRLMNFSTWMVGTQCMIGTLEALGESR
jgi:hypothetical protein